MSDQAVTPIVTLLGPGKSMDWPTPTGEEAGLFIQNMSQTNNLAFTIAGGPSTGILVRVGGHPMPSVNGNFFIPTAHQGVQFRAQGNFEGAVLTIHNDTEGEEGAEASVQIVEVE